MSYLESLGSMEGRFEKEGSGLEKRDVFTIEKSINELTGEIKQNQELKNRALAYASRE